MPETKNATFRKACLTIYNISEISELPDTISYLAYGEEVCPTTGRKHLQAFAYSTKPQRLTGWKKIFPGAHIEAMEGTFRDNEKYCSKEGSYHELGEKPMENGKKRVLLDLKERLDEGATYEDLVQENTFFEPCIRYRGGLQHYEQIIAGKRRRLEGYRRPEVHITIGPNNHNKTRSFYEADPMLYFMPRHDMKWCGSYNGHEAVLFDDVSTKTIMPVDVFLRICDGYPIEVESKGGFKWWNAKRIYFTSNIDLALWWPDASSETMAAVMRRVTHFTNLYYQAPANTEEHVSATSAVGASGI